MRNRWNAIARLSFLLLVILAAECRAETLALADWLDAANRRGIRIIYSSALVHPDFKVTIDRGESPSLDGIRQALHRFDLDLKPAGPGTWVVTRYQPGPVEMAPPPAERIAAPDMDEIIVTSSRYRLLIDQSPGLSVLDHDEIAARPVIANDAMRVVNQLPGNSSVGISVKPRVRGGNEDETLFLFNGIRLYEPFHLAAVSNLFSTIDGRIVESLDFYSGGFPPRLGDRASGVVSITSKAPAALGEVRELGVGLYNFSYLQAGRAGGGHYMIDVRRSSLELLNEVSETDFGRPRFSDLYARYDYELEGGGRLSGNLLWYGDKISLNNSSRTEAAQALYGNTYLWLHLEKELGGNGYSDTRIAVAGINTDRNGRIDTPGLTSGSLEDQREFRIYSLSQDVSKLVGGAWYLEAGLTWRHLSGEYESRRELAIEPAFSDISNFEHPPAGQVSMRESGQQIALYGRAKWSLGKSLTADAGVRLDAQNYINGWTQQISPRVNLLYELDPSTALRIGWGKFAQSQGLHELDLSDGVRHFQRPEKSIHQVISLTRELRNIDLRLELYRKRGVDDADYFENLTNPLTLVPELQFDRIIVNPDRFRARGIELSIRAEQDRTAWWINYTRSSARDTVDGVDIDRSWDQTHAANAGVTFSAGAWSVSFAGQYHTGWPTTPLFLANSQVEPGSRNSIRFEHYMSWDLKVTHQWRRALRLEAGITNLFNRQNQIGVEYETNGGDLLARPQYALGLAPFIDLYWRFQPRR